MVHRSGVDVAAWLKTRLGPMAKILETENGQRGFDPKQKADEPAGENVPEAAAVVAPEIRMMRRCVASIFSVVEEVEAMTANLFDWRIDEREPYIAPSGFDGCSDLDDAVES